MKFLILAASIAMAVYAEQLYTSDELTTMKQYSKECEEITTIGHDMILKMRQGTMMEDPELMNYLFCFFKKMKWMNTDGTMNKEYMKKMLSTNQIAMDAMTPCMEKEGSTGPETTFKMLKCYMENLPAGYKATL